MFEPPPPLKAPWNGDRHCLSPRKNGKVINIVINATPKTARFVPPKPGLFVRATGRHSTVQWQA